MIPSLFIRLYVKFRISAGFFGIGVDLGKFNKTWKVTLNPLSYAEMKVPYPDTAKVLFNRNGIKLSVWEAK